MNTTQKIHQLQKQIKESLMPLIDNDYWLLEVPYYPNVGDTLIWQGELDFLSTLPYKRKGMQSYFTNIPKNIAKDDIICMADRFPELKSAAQRLKDFSALMVNLFG